MPLFLAAIFAALTVPYWLLQELKPTNPRYWEGKIWLWHTRSSPSKRLGLYLWTVLASWVWACVLVLFATQDFSLALTPYTWLNWTLVILAWLGLTAWKEVKLTRECIAMQAYLRQEMKSAGERLKAREPYHTLSAIDDGDTTRLENIGIYQG